MLETLRQKITAVAVMVTMLVVPLALAPVTAYAATCTSPGVPAGCTSAAGGTDTTQTDINGALNCGATLSLETSSSCSTASTQGSDKINSGLHTGLSLFTAVDAIAAVFILIYGSMRYITSRGDSGKVSEAKNTIIYGLIGLVIAVFALFIVQFVLGKSQSL